jgi:hypothetical protein
MRPAIHTRIKKHLSKARRSLIAALDTAQAQEINDEEVIQLLVYKVEEVEVLLNEVRQALP